MLFQATNLWKNLVASFYTQPGNFSRCIVMYCVSALQLVQSIYHWLWGCRLGFTFGSERTPDFSLAVELLSNVDNSLTKCSLTNFSQDTSVKAVEKRCTFKVLFSLKSRHSDVYYTNQNEASSARGYVAQYFLTSKVNQINVQPLVCVLHRNHHKSLQ